MINLLEPKEPGATTLLLALYILTENNHRMIPRVSITPGVELAATALQLRNVRVSNHDLQS